MSVTAHITEQFLLKKEYSYLNFKWLVLGAYIPDGWGLSKIVLFFTENPAYHREILFGWLHSFPITGLLTIPVFYFFGKRAGISFLLSIWLHVATDALDTIGCKLFYPFSEHIYHFDWWIWKDGPIIQDIISYYTQPISLGIELFFFIGMIFVLQKGGGAGKRCKISLESRRMEITNLIFSKNLLNPL